MPASVRKERILETVDGKEAPLLRNSIKANVEESLDEALLEAVEALWRAGWRAYQARRATSASDPGGTAEVDHTLDGLLIALTLARQEDA